LITGIDATLCGRDRYRRRFW